MDSMHSSGSWLLCDAEGNIDKQDRLLQHHQGSVCLSARTLIPWLLQSIIEKGGEKTSVVT